MTSMVWALMDYAPRYDVIPTSPIDAFPLSNGSADEIVDVFVLRG